MELWLCIGLYGLAGILAWAAWEARAIRKTLQARWNKDSGVQGMVNHFIPCFRAQEFVGKQPTAGD